MGSNSPAGGSMTSRPAARSTTGTTARVNGTMTGGPMGRAISSVSPAPKSWTALHMPERRPVGERGCEADQVGVVIFVLGRRRQRRARQIKPQAPQRLGAVAVRDPRRGVAITTPLAVPTRRSVKRRSPALVFQRAIARDIFGIGGEALDPHRAAHAMRAGDDATQTRLPSAAIGSLSLDGGEDLGEGAGNRAGVDILTRLAPPGELPSPACGRAACGWRLAS